MIDFIVSAILLLFLLLGIATKRKMIKKLLWVVWWTMIITSCVFVSATLISTMFSILGIADALAGRYRWYIGKFKGVAPLCLYLLSVFGVINVSAILTGAINKAHEFFMRKSKWYQ